MKSHDDHSSAQWQPLQMASSAGKADERSTDLVAKFALFLSLLCSAGLVHVEFRLYSDKQLTAAGAVSQFKETPATGRPLTYPVTTPQQHATRSEIGLVSVASANSEKQKDVPGRLTQA